MFSQRSCAYILRRIIYSDEQFSESEQRWQTSRKIEKAKRLVRRLEFEYRDTLLADVDTSKQLLDWRNEVIHGRICANFERPDTLKSGRPNIPDRVVTPNELYNLADSLADARAALYRPMIFQIPRSMQVMLNHSVEGGAERAATTLVEHPSLLP